ncbi:MAG: chondroitinase-B domain-containing protein [Geminicoccaceae bacterium]
MHSWARRQVLTATAVPLAFLLPRLASAEQLALADARRELAAADDRELAAALETAEPGDHIVLGAGDFGAGADLTVTRGGSAGRPVVIRAASPGGARIGGTLAILADEVVVAGLLVTGNARIAGDRVRVTRCRFSDTDRIALSLARGSDVVVEYCAFERCRGRGLSIGPKGEERVVSAPHLHHNYFADFAGEAGENAHEALQVGQSGEDSLLRIGALVENNLFVRVDVDTETISVKSSGNTIRSNTFLDCRSRPTNRFGNGNRWEGNWIENCRGMWIYGGEHELVGNRVLGSREGIQIMAGNTSPDLVRPSRGGGRSKDFRPFCRNVRLTGNEAERLVVGRVIKQFGERYSMPAVDTRIAGHVGPIEYELETGTEVEETARVAAPSLSKLSPADVGPDAGA